MSTFKPHPVPPSSWRPWLKEALALSTKRWAANSCLVLLILAALAVLPQRLTASILPYLATPLVALFAVAAHSADTARPFREAVREGLLGIARVGVCAAGFIALLYAGVGAIVVLMLLADATPNGPPPPAPLPVNPSDFPSGSGALLMLFLWLLVPWTFFLVPLLACGRLPIRLSVTLAMAGFDMNQFVWRISTLAGLLCFAAALWHGAAAVPFYPIVGAMMYVAYRHVFLNLPPSLHADRARKLVAAAATR